MSEHTFSHRPATAVFLAALGLNAWALLLLVPVLHGLGVPHRPHMLPPWTVFAPLPLLAWGIGRLGRVLLLGAFPISLAVLHAVFQGPSHEALLTPLTFGLAAASLFAYLVGATVVIEVSSRRDDARSRSNLPARRLPRTWRRRRRMYWLLAAAAVAVPVSLLYAVDFHPATNRHLRQDYGRAALDMRTFMVLAGLTLWFWVFHAIFVQALEAHRRGDLDLRQRLRRLTAPAGQSGGRGLLLRLAVVALLLGLLLWFRQRYAAGGHP